MVAAAIVAPSGSTPLASAKPAATPEVQRTTPASGTFSAEGVEVKEMDRTGIPPKEIAAKVGIMPFLVGKYRAQAKAFTRKELRGIVEAGVQTEEDVKTGKMGDILSVELFLVQYSSKREK